jgi:hypothetical protein
MKLNSTKASKLSRRILGTMAHSCSESEELRNSATQLSMAYTGTISRMRTV